MDRVGWRLKLRPGMKAEYKKRHDEIWPEMTEVLNQAGIHNYTIWNSGNDLFGYYECDDFETAKRVQAESPVVARWDEYMKAVLDDVPMEYLENMFYHK